MTTTTYYMVRNVRKSIIENLADLFGDATKFSNSFTIYYDADMQNTALTPTRPCVFIINPMRFFETRYLPTIVVLPKLSHANMQLGDIWGYCELDLMICGSTIDMADDIAGAIMYHISQWSIYDWDSGSAVLQGTTGLDREWTQEYIPVPADLQMEGTLQNWEAISCGFPIPYFR